MNTIKFLTAATLLCLLIALSSCNRKAPETTTVAIPTISDSTAWALSGNSQTNFEENFIGTTDRQPLKIAGDSDIIFKINTAPGIWGEIKAAGYFRKGTWVTGLEMFNCDTNSATYAMMAVAKEHVKSIVKDEDGAEGYCDVGSKHFNVGNFASQGEQYLFLDWGIGKWNIGNTTNFSSAILGDTVAKKIVAFADKGLVVKRGYSPKGSPTFDSVQLYLARDTARVCSNLPVKIENNISANNISSGVYNPKVTPLKNILACTPYTSQYMRVGNTVTVSGKIAISAKAQAPTIVAMDLPLSTAITGNDALSGFGQSENGQQLAIKANVSNNNALLTLTAKNLSGNAYYYTFTYYIH